MHIFSTYSQSDLQACLSNSRFSVFGSYEVKEVIARNFKVPFPLPIFSQPACPPTLNPPPPIFARPFSIAPLIAPKYNSEQVDPLSG
jgi:hypothetical protein